MSISMSFKLFLFFYIYMNMISLSTLLNLCYSSHDSITHSQSLHVGKTLISSDQSFELGFFTPRKTNNKKYLGIWYKATPETVVWVANRDNPLVDSFGELSISENQNKLVILNSSKGVVWSSNSPPKLGFGSLVARLLDNGNFVLEESESLRSGSYLWQSFDHPTDTILAGMKFGWDLNSGIDRFLTSWKSDDDPSTGNYTYRISKKGLPQLVLSKGSVTKYRSGIWNGVRFSGVVPLRTNSPSNINYNVVINENYSYYVFELGAKAEMISRSTLNNSGLFQRFVLKINGKSKARSGWEMVYSRPYDHCDSYGYCGANGICRVDSYPICSCLEGFARRWENSWDVVNFSKGCKRKNALDCGKQDGFVKLSGLKLPDLLEFRLNKSMSLKECREACLKDCNCTAYANSDIRNGGNGCVMWLRELVDVREYEVNGSEQALYLRLSAIDMRSIRDSHKMKSLKVILIGTIFPVACFITGVVIWCMICEQRRNVKGQNMDHEDIELPVFDLDSISIATNNFSPANIVGEGGFGVVYKGNLETGQEVAIKRLSKDSRQGLREFKNEVDLIAKLQHKNLVALLGCCVQGDERMLIYEYLPNKSLDNYISGKSNASILSWKKKFEIIMGISKGLLYLHHDSKLQIVHRDLKGGNILLDINMIPKISDFGLARLLGGDENETTTKRVIGTYGYMSPEYAFSGKFSVKSDVYSFGVVLLEIVSGQLNTRFSHPDHSHGLLGHAWLLWNEGKALQLIENPRFEQDISLIESRQVMRCINVGLLCVQKYAEDRPTMNSVVFMLANEETKLPRPKEPGFFGESFYAASIVNTESNVSHNRVTITQIGGR